MYVVLGLLGLKKKKITQSLLTERLWGKKKKIIIHVYVVLGLLGLKKKKIIIHVHEVLSPWFEKKKNSCPCVAG